MRGDAYDLFDLLTWADRVRDHTIAIGGQPAQAYWEATEQEKILEAGEMLFKAFKAAEKTHRNEHGLDVGKAARKKVRYDAKHDWDKTMHRQAIVVKQFTDKPCASRTSPMSATTPSSKPVRRRSPVSSWPRTTRTRLGWRASCLATAALVRGSLPRRLLRRKMSALMDKKGDPVKKQEFKSGMNRGIVELL